MVTLNIKGKQYEVTDKQKARIDELWNELHERIRAMDTPRRKRTEALDNGYSPYAKITRDYIDAMTKIAVGH